MQCFEVEVGITYWDTKAQAHRERGLSTFFTVDDDNNPQKQPQATLAAIRWAQDRLIALKSDFRAADISSIKVGWYHICTIASNGFCNSSRRPPFFEWKGDDPSTLDENAERLLSILRAGT